MRLLSFLWRAADGLRKVLHLLVLLFVFGILLSVLSSGAPSLPAKAALLIPMQGDIVEQLEGDPFDRAIAELTDDARPQILLRDVIDALDYARTDDRIKAVVLDLGGLSGGGLSKLKRVAEALEEFRASGKPVIAHGDYFSQPAYYLAAHANESYMHPEGLLLLQGFGVYRNYYKEAIDKLQIDWNVFRAGTHKSYGEPYTRNDMSDEDRSSMSRILEQLWSVYREDISVARNIAPEQIDTMITDFLQLVRQDDVSAAQVAVDLDLIDGLLSRQELAARVAEYAGADDDNPRGYKAANFADYVAQMRLLDDTQLGDHQVAVVVAAGEILDGYQPPGTTGGESTAALLAEARKDDAVKAVVLRVDSPGGSIFASEVIRQEVEALQQAGKPVVASMSSVAASGGYWISMDADRILASEATLTGSIGVFAMFPTFERTLDALGVHTDGVGTSALAGAIRPDRSLSEEVQGIIQALVDEDYSRFIRYVAESRGMAVDEVDRIAQGQVWTGRDALDNGLIDEIGNLEAAIAAAAEIAELGDGGYTVRYIEQELSPGEMLVLQFLGGASALGIEPAALRPAPSSVARLAGAVERVLSAVTRFNDPRGLYSHCLCAVDFR